jgi:aminoglycoside phosphotransferase family enzyme
MDLAHLIEALADPSAYAGGVDAVEVHQAHISAVFLAGSSAYKIKKPVTLGFIDYGTVERRRHCCEEEVRLNRRLAPDVYLSVVPVTRDGDSIRMEGPGEALEWAVKMRRLPESATLRARLPRGGVTAGAMAELARRLAHRRDDASDAGWAIHREAARRWERPAEATRAVIDEVDAGGRPDETFTRSREALREAGLADRPSG